MIQSEILLGHCPPMENPLYNFYDSFQFIKPIQTRNNGREQDIQITGCLWLRIDRALFQCYFTMQ